LPEHFENMMFFVVMINIQTNLIIEHSQLCMRDYAIEGIEYFKVLATPTPVKKSTII
jgi:hypothetical protein